MGVPQANAEDPEISSGVASSGAPREIDDGKKWRERQEENNKPARQQGHYNEPKCTTTNNMKIRLALAPSSNNADNIKHTQQKQNKKLQTSGGGNIFIQKQTTIHDS